MMRARARARVCVCVCVYVSKKFIQLLFFYLQTIRAMSSYKCRIEILTTYDEKLAMLFIRFVLSEKRIISFIMRLSILFI